jgi:arginine deiminase
MHLDTVFTMVDYDKFTIHPNIMRDMDVFVIERDGSKRIRITQETSTLEDILKRHLHLDRVTLIKCGSNNVIDSAREQWNDGSNTLAIAPGEVIVYSRNYVTNEILQEHGVKTYVMPSSELSRGRGGPRCMSMPLIREDL